MIVKNIEKMLTLIDLNMGDAGFYPLISFQLELGNNHIC